MQYGDTKAFDQVYQLTNTAVFSLALSIVKNYAEAEDLMQCTYEKVIEKVNFYKPNTNGYAWILTITKNLSINTYNSRKREVVTDIQENEFMFPSTVNFEDADVPVFKLAKKVLNEQELSIVLLYAVSGYKHKEIAEILNKPLGTVLWSYNNALKKLRNNLGGNDEGLSNTKNVKKRSK